MNGGWLLLEALLSIEHYDVLAERSKALRSGRSLARGVGSNPTDVIFGAARPAAATPRAPVRMKPCVYMYPNDFIRTRSTSTVCRSRPFPATNIQVTDDTVYDQKQGGRRDEMVNGGALTSCDT